MMYSQQFVVTVKHNGRVLRETKLPGSDLTDAIFVPYGSEYSLFFKNMNSVRALVRVSIDGQDATKGTSLIVPANGSIELERFMGTGALDKGHRFKFIERTQKIEEGPRGIQPEDGLVRVEFEFEKQPSKIEYETIRRTFIQEYWQQQPMIGNPLRSAPTTWPPGTITCNASLAVPLNATGAQLSGTAAVATNAVNMAGITVPGAISEQKFQTGAWFPTDGQKHVMVLRLFGEHGGKKVEKPITVKTKQECPTCGTKNKHGTKFCRECGTGLELIG